jgi:hypothetical protein
MFAFLPARDLTRRTEALPCLKRSWPCLLGLCRPRRPECCRPCLRKRPRPGPGHPGPARAALRARVIRAPARTALRAGHGERARISSRLLRIWWPEALFVLLRAQKGIDRW